MKNIKIKHPVAFSILIIFWSLSCVALFPNTAKETSSPSITSENTPLSTLTPESTTPLNSNFTGQIVYNKGDDIYSINADGTNERRLATGYSPVWSPDGTQIAYIFYDELGQDIYIMNSDGTNQRPLKPVHPEYNSPKEIDWQTNGNLIVFSAYGGEVDTEIFSIDVDSKSVLQVTRNEPDDWSPSWSPDGKQIVYLSPVLNESIHDYEGRIHVMNNKGTDQILLTNNGRDSDPSVSPDGKFIAFTSARLDSNGRGTGYNLFIINSDGSNERMLSDDPLISYFDWSSYWASRLEWSPDGQFIILTTKNEENTYQLYIVSVDDGSLTYLTDGYGADWNP